MPPSPILLTSIPKAGTYFFAELLSELGVQNRHLHIAKHHAENLLLCSEEINKHKPSLAKVPLRLDQALYTVQASEFVFGHIAKPLLNDFALNRFKIIYSYRDHKAAMQAEFHWFRELRQDLPAKFTRYAHLSPEEHFIHYLKIYGPTRVRLFSFLDLWKSDPKVFLIDFDKFRAERDYAIQSILGLAQYLELTEPSAEEILERCLNKDNKTKVKRDPSQNLWSPQAEAIYSKLVHKQKFYDRAYPLYWALRKFCRV